MSEENQEMSDEEAIKQIALAMKENPQAVDDKNNVHTFLTGVIQTEDIDKVSKVGNLRDDEVNELGLPQWNVRGALAMARVSRELMGNDFFERYFQQQAAETLTTSLSRNGFLIKQGTTSTKQVADVTKRRKVNKGWFGKEKVEETGGDTTS